MWPCIGVFSVLNALGRTCTAWAFALRVGVVVVLLVAAVLVSRPSVRAPFVPWIVALCSIVVVGSRLRVPETARHTLKLPRPLVRIDADPRAQGKGYAEDLFLCADAALALDGLADRLAGRMDTDPTFHKDLAATRRKAAGRLRENVAPYDQLCYAQQEVAGSDFQWIRDVTISNGTWGNRLFRVPAPDQAAASFSSRVKAAS